MVCARGGGFACINQSSHYSLYHGLPNGGQLENKFYPTRRQKIKTHITTTFYALLSGLGSSRKCTFFLVHPKTSKVRYKYFSRGTILV
jgi:hypothetical protein